MQKVTFYLKALAIFTAASLVAHYWAQFTLNQSFLLASSGLVGWYLFRSVRSALEADSRFSPFWVRVHPNWDDILADVGLLDRDADDFWQEVREHSNSHSVLFRDIAFTVLKAGRASGLVYQNHHQVFRSDVELWEPIEEIQFEGNSTRRGWSPEVFVTSGHNGLELGLEVNSHWWRTMCSEDESGTLQRIEVDSKHPGVTTRLMLAVLPYSEFRMYVGVNGALRWLPAKKEKDWEAEIAKSGWKRQEEPELEALGAPIRVEHKYFAVEHRRI